MCEATSMQILLYERSKPVLLAVNHTSTETQGTAVIF